MTIQDAMQAQLEQLTSTQTQYQQDINNLIGMLGSINQQVQAITTWLAANP